MERTTNKHSPRVDDELKHDTQPLERSGAESRSDEFREQEPPGDYEPSATYQQSDGGWQGLGADPVTARRELSRHLLPSRFPGDRDALMAGAEEASAPQQVLDTLARLPQDRSFANTYDVWETLFGPIEEDSEKPRV